MSLKAKIDNALAHLRGGGLVIVQDDESRENEGDLVGIQEFITPDAINFMITYGRGLLCAPISSEIAFRHNLSLAPQTNYDGTNFTNSIDAVASTTGISAFERHATIQSLLSKEPVNFRTPGHVFPLIAKDGLLRVRKGHTEAAIVLAKLLHAQEVAAIVEVVADDGTMSRGATLEEFAQTHRLPIINIEELIRYVAQFAPIVETQGPRFNLSQISHLPTKFGEFQICVIKDKLRAKDYTLVFVGDIKALNGTIGRIHSACLTSETFYSLRCDCRQQLNFALAKIQENKGGFVLYTPDEGRGIGIFQKINAYHLQDNGRDTYEANVELNFDPDLRNFAIESKIFKFLGINRIKLITNNPEKIRALGGAGIRVSRIEYWEKNEHNAKYIETKQEKFKHY